MNNRPPWLTVKTRRRLQWVAYIVIFGVVLGLSIVLAAANAFRDDFVMGDRLSAINDVFAGASLVLALAVGLIALQAHQESTGVPDIRLQLAVGAGPPNSIQVVAALDQNGLLTSVPVAGATVLHLRLANKSRHEASDVLVSLEFEGCVFGREFGQEIDGWRVVDSVTGCGARSVEYEGFTVHGMTTRRVPSLDLKSLSLLVGATEASIDVRISSTRGYQRARPVPVHFLDSGSSAPTPNNSSPTWL